MSIPVAVSQDALATFCQRWKVTSLALFGSVLTAAFTPESDIDVLVTFAPDAHPGLSDLLTMEQELSLIFGREVDLGERRSVEEDPNYIRRKHILDAARIIYEA